METPTGGTETDMDDWRDGIFETIKAAGVT